MKRLLYAWSYFYGAWRQWKWSPREVMYTLIVNAYRQAKFVVKRDDYGPYQNMIEAINAIIINSLKYENFDVDGWAIGMVKTSLIYVTLGGPKTGVAFTEEQRDGLRAAFEKALVSGYAEEKLMI